MEHSLMERRAATGDGCKRQPLDIDWEDAAPDWYWEEKCNRRERERENKDADEAVKKLIAWRPGAKYLRKEGVWIATAWNDPLKNKRGHVRKFKTKASAIRSANRLKAPH